MIQKIPDPSKSIKFGSTNSGKYINVMYSFKLIHTYWQIMTPELTQNSTEKNLNCYIYLYRE